MKTCSKCRESKPLAEFHKNRTCADGLNWWCKDCTNGQKRPATVERMARNRANHRARQMLAERYPDEFRSLLDQEYPRALAEAQALADRQPGDKPVRLRPGGRRDGQTVVERIDVAWCEKCHEYHDSGHTCSTCGTSPDHETRVIRITDGQLRFPRNETVVLKP